MECAPKGTDSGVRQPGEDRAPVRSRKHARGGPRPGAKFVAAAVPFGGGQSVLVVWDGRTGEMLRRFDPQPRLTALALAPEDGLVAAGDRYGTIRVGAFSDGQQLAQFKANHVSIHCLAFARDVKRVSDENQAAHRAAGWLLAAGDAGGSVTVWDLRRQIPRSHCRGSLHDVFAVAFSSDGMALASGGRYYPMLWDVATGELICRLESTANYVHAVAFSPDGQQLAVAGAPRAAH